jgi:Domain of unknown function (DUF6259)
LPGAHYYDSDFLTPVFGREYHHLVKKGAAFLLLFIGQLLAAQTDHSLILENNRLRLKVDRDSGAIVSFYIRDIDCEMIGEPALANNFRISLPLDDYQAHYIDGMRQRPKKITKEGNAIIVEFSGVTSEKGNFPVDLKYTITLQDERVSFKARLTNHFQKPVAEFWFPRLGGWTRFGNNQEALLAIPNYNRNSRHEISLFRNYPGGRGLGAEAAEWSQTYPDMVMPWWDLYDEVSGKGLYLGYHDGIFRFSTWHTYLMPNTSGGQDAWLTREQAAGQPVGLVFSHIRYPFIQSGETLESGEFIIRIHDGDWHEGSKYYRSWFMARFPFDKSASWLRKESAWFTSIIYQPEDKIIADYKRYDQWTREAQKFGINCFELIGWNHGGLERNYPDYTPEEKLGGRSGFKELLKSIGARGGKCLVFTNYNIFDQNTAWYKNELHKYKQQDGFGQQNIWMGWGESTFLARSGMNVRYHVRSSVTPEVEKILADQFTTLVRDGAHGFQMDKLCVGAALDFNPLNTMKPDVALCEGLVQAIDRLHRQCRSVNPDFRVASEFGYDRLLPYFDVGYRNSSGSEISTLRYVFPEWTSCNHISAPRDFRGINGAVLTGAVLCLEPDTYQGSLDQPLYRDLASYIGEIIRIRKELADFIFTGDYLDDQGARIDIKNNQGRESEKDPGRLIFKVHGNRKTGKRAIVIANEGPRPVWYNWTFTHANVREVKMYSPFSGERILKAGEPVEIKPDGLQILIEI